MGEKVMAKERRITVEMRLRIDHKSFTRDVETKFINTLASIGDCPTSAITIISVRSGCTVVTLRMPPSLANEIMQLLYDYVHKFPTEDEPEEKHEVEAEEKLKDATPASRDLLGKFQLDAVNFAIDLTLISKRPPKKRAVVFVPGWIHNNSTFGNWPKDIYILPGQMYPGLLAPVYDKGAKQASVVARTDALASWIRRNCSQSKLAFVAHSLGGILVRRLVVALGRRLEQQISHIAFVASPHDMVRFSDDAKDIPDISTEQLKSLSKERGLLEALNGDWLEWVEKNITTSCQIMSIYTPSDQVLRGVPAKISSAEQITIVPDKDHLSIAKPEATEDEAAEFRRFIMEGGFFDERPSRHEEALQARMIHQFFQGLYLSTKSEADVTPSPRPLTSDRDRIPQVHQAVREPKR